MKRTFYPIICIKNTSLVMVIWTLSLFLLSAGAVSCGEVRKIIFEDPHLFTADDIRVSIFSDEVTGVRHMAFDDQGILFASQKRPGKVVALPDKNGDGKADEVVSILRNRRKPHGLAFLKNDTGYYLYVAEETRIIRMKRESKPYKYGKPEVIVENIPGGSGHSTRTIKIKGDKIYLSTGSSCNLCEESDPLRATIARFNLDGTGQEVFAKGLRNTVGMEFSPYTGELWGVNNGRDNMGDDHPEEELNIILKGKHYGWPYCYENQKPDPDAEGGYDCSKTEPPAHTFTAHMAPLGMAFYQKGSLPPRYNHSLFVSFHGSWNRSDPAGYKVVRVKLSEEGKILSHEDFVTGWLFPKGDYSGRPVDLELSPDGVLYLSDDDSSIIYRITSK